VVRKHQYNNSGVINRRHDLISVLRTRCHIAWRNPASDPVMLKILDDSIGDRRVLRGIADERVVTTGRLGRRRFSHSSNSFFSKDASLPHPSRRERKDPAIQSLAPLAECRASLLP
jgi:hypothetical protein